MNFDYNDWITLLVCAVLFAMAVYAFREPIRNRRRRNVSHRLGIAIHYRLYRESMRQRAVGCRN